MSEAAIGIIVSTIFLGYITISIAVTLVVLYILYTCA